MPQPITESELRSAAKVLNRSSRGRRALADAIDLLDNGGISLDAAGQRVLLTLLIASFTSHPGTAPDIMRETLDSVTA